MYNEAILELDRAIERKRLEIKVLYDTAHKSVKRLSKSKAGKSLKAVARAAQVCIEETVSSLERTEFRYSELAELRQARNLLNQLDKG